MKAVTQDYSTIHSLIWSFLRGRGGALERGESIDLVAYLMYASYISRNSETLHVANLDPLFNMDAVTMRLGNDYVAAQLLNAYTELESPDCRLPRIEIDFRNYPDLQRAILEWSHLLMDSGLTLEENDEFGVAHSIGRALEDIFTMGLGRFGGEYSSYASLAELVVNLADVAGQRVFDPACGSGVFLARAAAGGASGLRGADVDHGAIRRAKLLVFFSNPQAPAELCLEDSIFSKGDEKFARTVCAPPVGMRLKERMGLDGARALFASEAGVAPSGSNGEDYFIAKILSGLSDEGVAVVHIAVGFLFHQQRARRELRKALVEKGYVSAVIELPGGCIPGTAIKTALLVLTRQPQSEDVLLLDAASKAIEDKGYFERTRRMCAPTEAGIEWISDVLRSRREVSEVSILVSRERIVQTDGDLCYSTYGSVAPAGASLRPTEEIVSDMQEVHRRIAELDAQVDRIVASLK